MKRVLLVTDVPYWRREKGNQQRIAELVAFLVAHYAVTVFYMGHERAPRELAADIAGVRLVAADARRGLMGFAWQLFQRAPSRLQQRLITLLGLLRYRRGLAAFRNPGLLPRLRALCAGESFGAVIIEYVWHGYLAAAIDRSRSLAILDIHDIFHRRVADYARYGRVPDKTVTRDEELGVYAQFDWLLAIQRTEQAYLQDLFPGRVLLAMHPVRPERELYGQRLRSWAAPAAAGRKLNLVYFASFGDVNVDAVEWFVASVWNAELAGHFELRIYGVICESLRIEAPGVRLCGRAASVAGVYRDADIAINPARFGSGLKIKTVEALAHGVPVVTTSVGAEGLAPGRDRSFLCADDAGEFRAQLARLTDIDLRRTLSGHALAFVARELTPAACFGPLQAVIDAVTDNTASHASAAHHD